MLSAVVVQPILVSKSCHDYVEDYRTRPSGWKLKIDPARLVIGSLKIAPWVLMSGH